MIADAGLGRQSGAIAPGDPPARTTGARRLRAQPDSKNTGGRRVSASQVESKSH